MFFGRKRRRRKNNLSNKNANKKNNTKLEEKDYLKECLDFKEKIRKKNLEILYIKKVVYIINRIRKLKIIY